MTVAGRCSTAVDAIESVTNLYAVVASTGSSKYDVLFVVREVRVIQKQTLLQSLATFERQNVFNTVLES